MMQLAWAPQGLKVSLDQRAGISQPEAELRIRLPEFAIHNLAPLHGQLSVSETWISHLSNGLNNSIYLTGGCEKLDS